MDSEDLKSLEERCIDDAYTHYYQYQPELMPTRMEYVFKSPDASFGYFLMLIFGEVHFFARYRDVSYEGFMNGTTVKLISVHRNETIAYCVFAALAPQKIVYECLLPEFRTIVADERQTEKGKEYWFRWAAAALRCPVTHEVYLLDKRTTPLTVISVHSPEQLNSIYQDLRKMEDCFEQATLAIHLKGDPDAEIYRSDNYWL